ncbi:hypothetical protein SNEBB_000441 [Seison nebaliae]|nr:hypothetical protein SNEBB_000441 [Seison nebaliae]
MAIVQYLFVLLSINICGMFGGQWSENSLPRWQVRTFSRGDLKISPQCVTMLNNLIAENYRILYTYVSMTNYYTSEEQSLPGIAAFFDDSVARYIRTGDLVTNKLIKRGSTVQLQPIFAPKLDGRWGSSVRSSLVTALNLEVSFTKVLRDISRNCGMNDPDLKEFLVENLITSQQLKVHQLSSLINRATTNNDLESQIAEELDTFISSKASSNEQRYSLYSLGKDLVKEPKNNDLTSKQAIFKKLLDSSASSLIYPMTVKKSGTLYLPQNFTSLSPQKNSWDSYQMRIAAKNRERINDLKNKKKL